MGRRWNKGRFGHEDIVALAEGTASSGQGGDGEWIRSDRTQQDAMWISIPPQTEHNHVPRPLLFGTGSGDEGRRQFDARSGQKRLGADSSSGPLCSATRRQALRTFIPNHTEVPHNLNYTTCGSCDSTPDGIEGPGLRWILITMLCK